MTDEFTTIRLSIADGIGRLTLANGARGNPLGPVSAPELLEAAIRLDESKDLRAVLISADGKNFCVGGDLGHFAQADDLSTSVKRMTAMYHSAIAKLLRMRAPIVCAVQGACAGAGVPLAAMGDLVIGAQSSHYTIAYTAIGFSPDGASTWVLPRVIGMRRFQELALTNRRIDADEAARIGLLTEVASDDAVLARAEELVASLAQGATGAIGAVRQLLLASFDNSLETQLELESRLLSDQCRGDDVREGISAVLARRAANFTGRVS